MVDRQNKTVGMATNHSLVPYILLLFDLIFAYAVYHQFSTRFRVKKSFAFLEYVTSHVFHPKKDGYRLVGTLVILFKIFENIVWIGRQWNIGHLSIPIWMSWLLFGGITSMSQFVICDFASLITELEYSIVNNQHLSLDKQFCCYITPQAICCEACQMKWKFVIFACGSLSALFVTFGCLLTVFVDNSLILAIFCLLSIVLDSFIIASLIKSVIQVTRETEHTTTNVRTSLSVEEYQRQVIGLFQMKQILFSLVFLILYPIFAAIYFIYSIAVKFFLQTCYLIVDLLCFFFGCN